MSILGTARSLGIRWLRKYPGATLTVSPAFPSLSMSYKLEIENIRSLNQIQSQITNNTTRDKIDNYSCKDDLELPVVSQSLRCIQEWVYHNTIITGISKSNDLPNTMSAKLKITHSDLDSESQSPLLSLSRPKTNNYQYQTYNFISSKING